MAINREIVNAINENKKMYPILAISGPRQSGKTTMLKESFPEYQYLSLEDIHARNFLANDPKGFFEKYDKFCIEIVFVESFIGSWRVSKVCRVPLRAKMA